MKHRAYMIDKDCNRWTTMVEEEATTTHVVERRHRTSVEYEMHKVMVADAVIALVGVEKIGTKQATLTVFARALFGDDVLSKEET